MQTQQSAKYCNTLETEGEVGTVKLVSVPLIYYSLPKEWYYKGSLLSSFVARASLTFLLMCVHIVLAWVCLLSYDPFGKSYSLH